MTIPNRLKIGAHQYQVVIRDIDKCGETDREKQRISLASWLNGTQKEVTLIHEILHTINNELDHTLLDSLAEQLYQALKDNKLLK